MTGKQAFVEEKGIKPCQEKYLQQVSNLGGCEAMCEERDRKQIADCRFMPVSGDTLLRN